MTFRSSLSFLLISPFISFVFNFTVAAQRPAKSDTLQVCKTVTRFYDWYIKMPKENKNSEIQPAFVEDDKGMTTLNFSKYLGNLKKYNFSDSLINKEKMSYQLCISNLEKIKFSEFNSSYNDLDDLERISCDFGNSYRWTGGQEATERIKITNVKFETNNHAIVTVERLDNDSKNNGSLLVILMKIDSVWKISKVNL